MVVCTFVLLITVTGPQCSRQSNFVERVDLFPLWRKYASPVSRTAEISIDVDESTG